MMNSDFLSQIRALIEVDQNPDPLAESFLSDTADIKRYLIGKNEQAKELLRLVHINGIIDDFSAPGAKWEGIPVLQSSNVEANAFVVNCATSISPVSVQRKFTQSNFRFLHFYQVQRAARGRISMPAFSQEMSTEIDLHAATWEKIYGSLKDEESKHCLLNTVCFRLTTDPRFMQDYRVRIQEQYMEDFLVGPGEVFVDAGGFDGDTTEEFCRRYPGYKKILFFEPSDANLQKAKQRLRLMRDVHYFNIGLSDRKETLYFNPNAGSASSIITDPDNTAHEKIEVERLDNLVKEKISIIKMDLEGWELNALKGAETLISEHHPKLAIAVYHRSGDYREIFDYLMSINPNQDVYLRHYTEGWSETIMFFIPR